MGKILIIDDDKMLNDLLKHMVERMGHSAECAYTIKDGLQSITDKPYDIVFLDVCLPDGNGLDLLADIRTTQQPPEVIIITAAGNPDGAELAIKNGAWDYIEKPSSIEKMTLPLMRALQYREEKNVIQPLKALKRDNIIGSSRQIQECLDLVAQAASTDATALISGETGTGKELFAWAIHENSSRNSKNFVVVDCASLPDTLVESSLFGYKKGAFTGADRDMDGLIKQADGGTLFLDEIGELPLKLQKSFLRVLQEHRFRPIASKQEETSNFRVVAATNRNLKESVQKGLFRNDLLFRLQSISIELPPLRHRPDDVKELTMHYVAKICDRNSIETKGFSPDFFDVLTSYDWPGNVRELVNTIEWTISSAQNNPTLFPSHLPPELRIHLARSSINKNTDAKGKTARSAPELKTLQSFHHMRKQSIEKAEKQYLENLIAATSRNIKEACRVSELSRPRLYALLKKYNLSRQD